MMSDGVRADYPWRRMIAVSVFFVGLIGPAFALALQLLFVHGGLLGAGLAAWLGVWLARGLRAIWKGSYQAYQTAIVVFSLGVAFSLVALYPAAASPRPLALPLAVAAVLYFGLGLAAVVSVYGPWFSRK